MTWQLFIMLLQSFYRYHYYYKINSQNNLINRLYFIIKIKRQNKNLMTSNFLFSPHSHHKAIELTIFRSDSQYPTEGWIRYQMNQNIFLYDLMIVDADEKASQFMITMYFSRDKKKRIAISRLPDFLKDNGLKYRLFSLRNQFKSQLERMGNKMMDSPLGVKVDDEAMESKPDLHFDIDTFDLDAVTVLKNPNRVLKQQPQPTSNLDDGELKLDQFYSQFDQQLNLNGDCPFPKDSQKEFKPRKFRYRPHPNKEEKLKCLSPAVHEILGNVKLMRKLIKLEAMREEKSISLSNVILQESESD